MSIPRPGHNATDMVLAHPGVAMGESALRREKYRKGDVIVSRTVVVVVLCALAGCSAEVAGTAATGAAIKKQEIQEGKRTEERMRNQIEQATDVSQQRARQDAEK